jgi:hypothetical protein
MLSIPDPLEVRVNTMITSRLGRNTRDLRNLPIPSAVIGDVHGCWHTLSTLLDTIGINMHHGDDVIVSVGDLHDKGGVGIDSAEGPAAAGSVQVLRWSMEQHANGRLIVVDSNHGQALVRRIASGKHAKPSVETTYDEIMAQHDAATLAPAVRAFLSDLPLFARFQGGPTGEIVVAHAAVAERLYDQRHLRPEEERFSVLARTFRWNGEATAVVGHIRTSEPTRVHNDAGGDLLRIDTGCGESGGRLTAWLPGSDEFVSVPVDPRDLRP